MKTELRTYLFLGIADVLQGISEILKGKLKIGIALDITRGISV